MQFILLHFLVHSGNFNDFVTKSAEEFVRQLPKLVLDSFALMSPMDRVDAIIKLYVEKDNRLDKLIPQEIKGAEIRRAIAIDVAVSIAGLIQSTAPALSSFYSTLFRYWIIVFLSIYLYFSHLFP